MVEPGRARHRDAVRRLVGHHDLRRRSLRPARDHDRQRRQRDDLGRVANVRVDNTAPSGALTAPVASAIIKGHVRAHVGLGRQRLRCAQCALPALARRCRHLDERGDGRYHRAVRRKLDHDDPGRRAVRPARRHHRPRGQHVHLGARDGRPRRQHRPDWSPSRRRPPLRTCAGRSRSRRARRMAARAWPPSRSRARRTPRAPGRP